MRILPGALPLLFLLAACPGDITDFTEPPGNCSPAAAPGTTGLGCVADRYSAEVSVGGDYAYTTTWGRRAGNNGNAFYVWDVRGAAPALVDSVIISGATTLGDVQVSDDGAWLVVATEYSTGSIVIFDLADPRHPVQAARFTSPNTAPGVHTAQVSRVGGRQHAFLSVDPSGNTPARLVILDLANPRQPVELTSLTIGSPFVHDVFVRDGLLFAALWNEGVRIYDIGGGGRGGTPASPVAISTVATVDGAAHNVWWFHDPSNGSRRYLFVGEEQPGALGADSQGDIHVVDLADLANPREVAFYHLPDAGTHNFVMDEPAGILYAAYYNRGVQAINVRGDLGGCPVAQQDAHGRCDLGARRVGHALDTPSGGRNFYIWGVDLRGGKLYASDMLNGVWKMNTPLPN